MKKRYLKVFGISVLPCLFLCAYTASALTSPITTTKNLTATSAEIITTSDTYLRVVSVSYENETPGINSKEEISQNRCNTSGTVTSLKPTFLSCFKLSNLLPDTQYSYKTTYYPQTSGSFNVKSTTSSLKGKFTTPPLSLNNNHSVARILPIATPTPALRAVTKVSTQVTYNQKNSITITWDDTNTEKTNFNIFRILNDGTPQKIASVASSILEYKDTNLMPGTYIYAISVCKNTSTCSTNTYSTLTTITEPRETPQINLSFGDDDITLTKTTDSATTNVDTQTKTTSIIKTTPSPVVITPVINASSFLKTETPQITLSFGDGITSTKTTSNTTIATSTNTQTSDVSTVTTRSFSTTVTSDISSVKPVTTVTAHLISSTSSANNLSSTVATTTPQITLSFGDDDITSTKTKNSTTNLFTPSKPKNIEITLKNKDSEIDSLVIVKWEKTSNNEEYFRLYRSFSKGGKEFSKIDKNITSYSDTNVPAGEYRYYVSACNSLGCSESAESKSFLINEKKATIATKNTQLNTIIAKDDSYNEISNALGKVNPGSFIVIKPLGELAVQKNYETRASSEGKFSIKVPDGTYLIEGISPSKILTLSNSKVVNISEKINIGNKSIDGVVSLEDGTILGDAEIIAYNSKTNESISTTTNQSGFYTLKVSPGIWNISFHPKNQTDMLWKSISQEISTSFTLGEENETKHINLKAVAFSSKINITVKDEKNIPMEDILVTLDTVSSSNSQKNQTDRERSRISEKTNNQGFISIETKPGTYFIHITLPEKTKYTIPQEQSLTVYPKNSKEISFILKQENIITSYKVSGFTTFSDGVKTNAFVSAWSNEGDRTEARTTINGAYTLELKANKKWQIKAIKDEGKQSYKTDIQTIDFINSEKQIDLIFVKEQAVPLTPSVTVQSDAKKETVIAVEDGTSFTLPPNASKTTGDVTLEIKPTTEAISQITLTLVSKAYDITVKNKEGVEVKSLASEAEILIPYDDEELKSKGVSLESIIPSYFDEKLGTWISVSKFIINKEKKVFVLYVNHLTRFALIASADTVAPSSPTNVVTDAITPTDVRISWNNPTNDFHHSKVYRSEIPGVSGSLVAAEVLSNSFIDKTYSTTDKTYYYTIKSVDAAGNESSSGSTIAFLGKANTSLLANNRQETPSLLLPPGQLPTKTISRMLSIGSKGDDVTELQKALKLDGFYKTGPITGYFGKLTENAVYRFQNYYKAEILIPNGYTKSTGVVGLATRKKINEIILAGSQ